MATNCCVDMDSRTSNYIHHQLGLELGWYVAHWNAQVAEMDILNRIKAAKGAVDRVTANVDKKLETVFALEAKADDLSNKATAPAIRQLDSINSELTEIVSALEGNRGPSGPLPGDSPSTPSDGQSALDIKLGQLGAENPTQPQS